MVNRYRRYLYRACCSALVLGALFIVVSLLDGKWVLPVQGMSQASYNSNSFWAYPWGSSVTHKGVDIFAPRGTPVIAARSGLVWESGYGSKGGNFIAIASPFFEGHLYAHLTERYVDRWGWVNKGQVIGTVGDTGNAAGKPTHLHYAIGTFLLRPELPFPEHHKFWWPFFIDPVERLNSRF